jgi:hypothetical protein
MAFFFSESKVKHGVDSTGIQLDEEVISWCSSSASLPHEAAVGFATTSLISLIDRLLGREFHAVSCSSRRSDCARGGFGIVNPAAATIGTTSIPAFVAWDSSDAVLVKAWVLAKIDGLTSEIIARESASVSPVLIHEC